MVRSVSQGMSERSGNWARELWQVQSDVPDWLRDYVTAHCLPVNEGQSYILQDIKKIELMPIQPYIDYAISIIQTL